MLYQILKCKKKNNCKKYPTFYILQLIVVLHVIQWLSTNGNNALFTTKETLMDIDLNTFLIINIQGCQFYFNS